MTFVQSSNVEAIGYDVASVELHVRFVKSGIVEEWRFQELM
jgi:hypothetical protein